MTKYYATWYKTGVQPAIEQDQVFAYHRPTSKYATASNDILPAPVQWNVTDDAVYATAFLTPNTPVAYIGVTTGGSMKTFPATPGITRVAQSYGMTWGLGLPAVALLDSNKNPLVSVTSLVPITNWTLVREGCEDALDARSSTTSTTTR